MSEPQLLSAEPKAGQLLSTDPHAGVQSPDALLQQARTAAAAGDMEGANAAFFQIPAAERKQRGVYAGPGGGDATGSGALALAGATGIANVARAVGGAGPTFGARVFAGAKEAVTQAAPIVKYEATKTLLEKMGVPEPLAISAAIAVSGYRRGENGVLRPSAPVERAPTAARVERTAAAATPPAPSPAPTAPATAVPPEIGKALKTLMTEGGLNLEEANQALKWMKAGVSLETIQERIQAARQLAGKPAFVKLPSSADVAAAVKERNATDRWPGNDQ